MIKCVSSNHMSNLTNKIYYMYKLKKTVKVHTSKK